VHPHDAQKHVLKPWQQRQWGLPPRANAAFVWAREDVREVYTRPDDSRRPQVGLDETSKQLVAETREPLPAASGPPERVEYEYERPGTANLCMVFAPLAGQRRVKVTERRTAVDCAHVMQELGEAQYPPAEKMVLVRDHLHTHQPASL
jgi:DDE superfamily endonuclease